MALPSFGGTNGVSLLDIGQPGGTRHGASEASATLRCLVGITEVAEVINELAEQNITWRDVLGSRGRPIVWKGVIRANSNATMNTIEGEIELLKSGHDPAAATHDPTQMYSTQLTDSWSRQYAAVVLRDYQPLGPRFAGTTWAAVQQMALLFRELGDTSE